VQVRFHRQSIPSVLCSVLVGWFDRYGIPFESENDYRTAQKIGTTITDDTMGVNMAQCFTSKKKGIASSAFLIVALVVSSSSCTPISRTPCPVQSSVSPIQLSDANGVPTYGIVPSSYNRDVQSRWVLYNHGSAQSGLAISTNPHDSCLVNTLVQAG
jgi:hypothetical protein